MRAPLAVYVFALASIGTCIGGCGARDAVEAPPPAAASTATKKSADDSRRAASEPLLTHVDARAPYAGEWVAERTHCDDDKQKWTIEPHRMAIVPAMRFCAFDNVYVNRAADEGETSWSAGATCLAEGRESHDFLFFRVNDDLREMRVTFNDSRSVQLYRCLAS